MEQKYEITKGAILRAAEKCSTAKEVLKVMFPEAFESENLLANLQWDVVEKATNHLISIDSNSPNSFYLTNERNWDLKRHPNLQGSYFLTPTKRQ